MPQFTHPQSAHRQKLSAPTTTLGAMTQPTWPAWALTNNERCQPHGDPGCPVCSPPIDDNEGLIDDADEIQAAQNRYETSIGWGRDQL